MKHICQIFTVFLFLFVTGATYTVHAGVLDNMGTFYENNDEVGTIGRYKTAQVLRRKEALHLLTFGFGPATFINYDSENSTHYHFYGGYLFEPHVHAAVKTLLDVTSDFDNSVMTKFSIGAQYYFLRKNMTPYIGGSLGLGYVDISDEGNFGFIASCSAGIMLFRTSDVHLNIEIFTDIHTKEIDDKIPAVTGGRIGISF